MPVYQYLFIEEIEINYQKWFLFCFDKTAYTAPSHKALTYYLSDDTQFNRS